MESLVSFGQGPLGLLALALVAFSDTLIGVGFFVPGELAFLAAGASWGAGADVTPIFVVLVSAWLADQTSYWIGRRFGPRAAAYWLVPSRRRNQWRKARRILMRHGATAVIISRVLGPVAWITPFLAGASNMPMKTFLWSSGLGVMIGVGQFIIYGSLLAAGLQSMGAVLTPVLEFFAGHWSAALVVAMVLIVGVVTWRWLPSRFAVRMGLSMCSAMLALTVINAIYFFGTRAHAITPVYTSTPELHSVCDLKSLPFLVKPGPTSLHRPQPINVVMLSNTLPQNMMTSLGWLQNKTYSHDKITFADFLVSLFSKELPVSELYWLDRPADSAFQLPGSLSERVHMRWWKAGVIEGQSVYVASLSRDEEIAIKYYKHIPSLLHDIARDVDYERDLLRAQIDNVSLKNPKGNLGVLGTFPLGQPVKESEKSEYFTDGGVLFIGNRSIAERVELTDCLSNADKKL